MSPEIGQLQPLGDGEKIFQDFMEMRNRPQLLDKLKNLFSTVPDALRYYTEDQLFFVFKKKIIQTLLDRLNNNDDDIVVLYPGIRNDGRPGRPTLIVCPYKKVEDKFELVLSDDGTKDLGEHSGLTAQKKPSGIAKEIELKDININFL